MWVGLEIGCVLAALCLLIQRHVASLHYTAFLLSRWYVSVVFGPTYSIIFVASVNVIFSSSCFPVCVTEHYSIACMRRVSPFILAAIWTCAPSVKSAAVTVCVRCPCGPLPAVPLGVRPGLDGRSHSNSALTLRTSKLGSAAAEPFCTPTSTVQTPVSPHPHECWPYF